MLTLIAAVKLLTELALLLLLGRGVLGLLAGSRREGNAVYRLLVWLTQPWVRVARWISPRVVLDRHLPLVAFLVLGMAWVAVTVTKVVHCVSIGVALCR